jgi:uncharacterized protein YyaL (SSP411 family)
MKKRMFFPVLFSAALICASFKPQQTQKPPVTAEIHWYTFQEAFNLNKKKPKKIFIDVYTDWCGWCKKMDATTYKDPVIIKLMNKYFYAVKLNAEMKDTVIMDSVRLVNPRPDVKGSTHQLATSLLNNQMGYPTAVVLSEKLALMSQPIAGYLPSENLEPILVFLGESYSLKESWEEFSKNYKSQNPSK